MSVHTYYGRWDAIYSMEMILIQSLSMLDNQCVGGHLMACQCAGQGKIPGQSLWEFLVDKVALGQDCLCFSPVSFIPHSSQYH